MRNAVFRVAQGATLILEISGAILLVLMMLLTFADVIGRYFFNSPIDGAFEVTELMLAILLYCGLPLISLRDGHVTVDLFENAMSVTFRRIRDILVHLAMSASLVFVAIWLWEKANDSGWETTAILLIPLAPLMRFMAISSLFSALLTLMLLFKPSRDADSGRTVYQ